MPSNRCSKITDPEIAWDAESGLEDAAWCRLSDAVLEEVDQNRALIGEPVPTAGIKVDNSAFPLLRQEVAFIRANLLERGFGFSIVRGLASINLTQTEMETIFWRLCNEMGSPFIQKSGYIKFGRVENLGLPSDARPRYHETGVGGSIHTDSPIMPRVADFVGLLCVRAAVEGGQSKFVSVASIHNLLLEHAGDLLEELYQPFFFDRRLRADQVTADNPAVLYEPIFSYDPMLGPRGLRMRWQPEYVWQAPHLDGVPPLTERQRMALHLLEGLLEDRAEQLTIKMSMSPGDIQLVNNHVLAHGRTMFIDYMLGADAQQTDPERRRLMRRVWMHKKTGTAHDAM